MDVTNISKNYSCPIIVMFSEIWKDSYFFCFETLVCFILKKSSSYIHQYIILKHNIHSLLSESSTYKHGKISEATDDVYVCIFIQFYC